MFLNYIYSFIHPLYGVDIVHTCRGAHVKVRGQRTTCRNRFSRSTASVPETALRSSGSPKPALLLDTLQQPAYCLVCQGNSSQDKQRCRRENCKVSYLPRKVSKRTQLAGHGKERRQSHGRLRQGDGDQLQSRPELSRQDSQIKKG